MSLNKDTNPFLMLSGMIDKGLSHLNTQRHQQTLEHNTVVSAVLHSQAMQMQNAHEIKRVRAEGAEARKMEALKQAGAAAEHARGEVSKAAEHGRSIEHFTAAADFAKSHPAGGSFTATFPSGVSLQAHTPAPSAPAADAGASTSKPRRKKGEMIEEPMFTEKGNIPKKVL